MGTSRSMSDLRYQHKRFELSYRPPDKVCSNMHDPTSATFYVQLERDAMRALFSLEWMGLMV
jgi:hypothetical protein